MQIAILKTDVNTFPVLQTEKEHTVLYIRSYINMRSKGKVYVKLLEQYKPCVACKKVMVKRVFLGYDFLPVCCDCRQVIDRNKGGN